MMSRVTGPWSDAIETNKASKVCHSGAETMVDDDTHHYYLEQKTKTSGSPGEGNSSRRRRMGISVKTLK